MATKTTCPITRSEFKAKAVQVPVVIGTKETGVGVVYGQPKEFSTHSVGYYANGKVTLLINGKPTVCQVGVNITVVGSKELPTTPDRPERPIEEVLAEIKAKPETQAIMAAAAGK